MTVRRFVSFIYLSPQLDDTTVLGDLRRAHPELHPGDSGRGGPFPFHPGANFHRGAGLLHRGEYA